MFLVPQRAYSSSLSHVLFSFFFFFPLSFNEIIHYEINDAIDLTESILNNKCPRSEIYGGANEGNFFMLKLAKQLVNDSESES